MRLTGWRCRADRVDSLHSPPCREIKENSATSKLFFFRTQVKTEPAYENNDPITTVAGVESNIEQRLCADRTLLRSMAHAARSFGGFSLCNPTENALDR